MSKVLVFTLYDIPFQAVGNVTSKNHAEYARFHGYDFIKWNEFSFERVAATWVKIRMAQKYLPDYDYIFWIDADAAITNFSVNIEDLFTNKYPSLKKTVATKIECSISGKEKIFDIELLRPKEPCMAIGTCNVNGPCMGTFALKNESYSFEILDKIWSHGDKVPLNNAGDNLALFSCLVDGELNTEKIKVLPHNCMNSFWKTHKKGDFILHLPGTLMEDRMKFLESLETKIVK